jgi:hypothetical protein
VATTLLATTPPAAATRTLMATQAPIPPQDGPPSAVKPVPKWGYARAPESGTAKQSSKAAAGDNTAAVAVDGEGELAVVDGSGEGVPMPPGNSGNSGGVEAPIGNTPTNTPTDSPSGDSTRLYDFPQWNGGVLSWCWGWGKECGESAAAKFCQAKGHRGVASIGGQVAMPKGSSVVVPEGGILGPKCTSGVLLTCHTFASITCRE